MCVSSSHLSYRITSLVIYTNTDFTSTGKLYSSLGKFSIKLQELLFGVNKHSEHWWPPQLALSREK